MGRTRASAYSHKHQVEWDVRRLRRDIASRGWLATDLAREARVSDVTVHRFLTAKRQTARTAKKLAGALGYSTRRYLLHVEVPSERAS